MATLDTIQRRCRIINETDKAYLVKFPDCKKAQWITKALAEMVNERENSYTGIVTHTLELPKWLYDKIINE